MGLNFEDIFLNKEDLEKKKNEQEEDKEDLSFALDFAAELYPNEKIYTYARESFYFTHKVSSLINQKYDHQAYKELTNIIQQFDKILDDYLKEKGLKYEE